MNIVATAKFVVVEMWLVPCERKVIQRTTLNGKIKAQYTTGYLADTRYISISLHSRVYHLRKHCQGLAFDCPKLGIGAQFRFLQAEFPPSVFIELEVATTPKIKRDTYEERDPNCEPKPKILGPDAPSEVMCAYPTPILRSLSKTWKYSLTERTYWCW